LYGVEELGRWGFAIRTPLYLRQQKNEYNVNRGEKRAKGEKSDLFRSVYINRLVEIYTRVLANGSLTVRQ